MYGVIRLLEVKKEEVAPPTTVFSLIKEFSEVLDVVVYVSTSDKTLLSWVKPTLGDLLQSTLDRKRENAIVGVGD